MATSIKTRIEALQREHDAAVAEVADLEAKISALEAERASIKLPTGGHTSQVTEPERRFSALGGQIETARSRVNDLTRDTIAGLQKRMAYLRKVESCGRDMDAARTDYAAAKSEIATIAARHTQVQNRLAAMQAEQDTAAAQFDEAEQIAAQAYAQSVAEGNERAMQEADARLKDAQEARAVFDQQVRRQQAVIDALNAELTRLEGDEREAEARADDARKAFGAAVQLRYAAQWDAAVDQLEIAGARLAAAVSLAGGSTYYLFRELKVQRREPGMPDLYGERILRQGEELELPESL
ncbi:hypothetical protein IAI53_07650 [Thauera sp. CAU 1555]|uniref:Uncharacterized protein n=1 Tax=Thauera sedimentorum TaxID=2767595 RepID=A0ABR9B9X2_9RHOO|nr:hypothetical protein [Thauera sedimentorum]MBC9071840.1 hypothetical protein [Thauera sedimentorum]MBD8502759.1 hypothetical protein [Thauera sedimentorum]